jgi:hypothetical protein
VLALLLLLFLLGCSVSCSFQFKILEIYSFSMLVTFFCLCDKISDISYLREEGFIFAHSFCGFTAWSTYSIAVNLWMRWNIILTRVYGRAKLLTSWWTGNIEKGWGLDQYKVSKNIFSGSISESFHYLLIMSSSYESISRLVH